jgi:hypothetical protein
MNIRVQIPFCDPTMADAADERWPLRPDATPVAVTLAGLRHRRGSQFRQNLETMR